MPHPTSPSLTALLGGRGISWWQQGEKKSGETLVTSSSQASLPSPIHSVTRQSPLGTKLARAGSDIFLPRVPSGAGGLIGLIGNSTLPVVPKNDLPPSDTVCVQGLKMDTSNRKQLKISRVVCLDWVWGECSSPWQERQGIRSTLHLQRGECQCSMHHLLN